MGYDKLRKEVLRIQLELNVYLLLQ